MGAIMDQLWSVQQLQSELYEARRRRDNEEKLLLERARKLDELRRSLAAKRDELLRKQADIKACELDTKVRQEHISGLRVKLNLCRNSKEYNALLSEIASAETQGEQILERSYKLDDEKKAVAAQTAALEQQLKADEEAFRRHEAEARTRLSVLNERLAGFEKRRKYMLAEVPAKARMLFERLSAQFDGQAIAPMEPVDGEEGDVACSNCNITLTAGTVSAAINIDEPRTCPTCSRILYYQG